jgi:hypothetical protein
MCGSSRQATQGKAGGLTLCQPFLCAAATLAQGFRAALNELGKGKSGMRMSHGAM